MPSAGPLFAADRRSHLRTGRKVGHDMDTSRPVIGEPQPETLADLVARLGSIPLEGIPARPAPGTATEADVLSHHGGEKRVYELVEGVLVEKPAGYYES